MKVCKRALAVVLGLCALGSGCSWRGRMDTLRDTTCPPDVAFDGPHCYSAGTTPAQAADLHLRASYCTKTGGRHPTFSASVSYYVPQWSKPTEVHVASTPPGVTLYALDLYLATGALLPVSQVVGVRVYGDRVCAANTEPVPGLESPSESFRQLLAGLVSEEEAAQLALRALPARTAEPPGQR